MSLDGFKIFSDNMEHYNIEELIISRSRLFNEQPFSEVLLNGLRSANRSIKKIKISESKYLQEQGFAYLCKIMAANRITEFSCVGYTTTESTMDLISFNEVIKANHIKKLRIQGNGIGSINLAMISEELQTNTSLTDLMLFTLDLDFKTLGSILTKNKTIRRLEVSNTRYSADSEQVSFLNLGSNTTITDLILAPFKGLDLAALFSSLCSNQTIRRLKAGSFENLANYDKDLEKFLTTNHSVQDFDILNSLEENVIQAIIRSLRVNRMIRKLSLRIPRIKYAPDFLEFMTVMETNMSITDLNITEIGHIQCTGGNTTDYHVPSFFQDLAKKNKTLRYINGSSE